MGVRVIVPAAPMVLGSKNAIMMKRSAVLLLLRPIDKDGVLRKVCKELRNSICYTKGL